MTNISQELLHVGFWYKCCEPFVVLCEREPDSSYLFFPEFLHFSFSPIFKYKKISSLFSQGLRGTQKLKLGPHMDSRLMYHVYLNQAAGVYLFLKFSFSQIPKH